MSKIMSKTNRHKILNDPIYGFVTLRHSFTLDILDHPFVQRLRRISQLGLSHLVYPGAVHNRFHHAVGSLFLMQEAIDVLRTKGIEITKEEDEAVCFAILLHDVGHSPFSHALEHSIVKNVHHEEISTMIMDRLNQDFDGKLTLAIKIYNNKYSKKFLHQLVSSQLDMDRLDYLARDSFYSGVTEGKVGSVRIIKMLSVSNDQLVVEEKGIYSVEKFIVARRLMYWQVYLHRTVISAEHMLTLVVHRAKYLAQSGIEIFATPALLRFLKNDIDKKAFKSTPNIIDSFCELDDSDIFSAMKAWRHHSDKVLSSLSSRLLDRKLFQIELRPHPFTTEEVHEKIQLIAKKLGLSNEEASYFVSNQSIENRAYTTNGILIKYKDGSIRDFAESNDHLSLELLTKPVKKSFLCYPKDLV